MHRRTYYWAILASLATAVSCAGSLSTPARAAVVTHDNRDGTFKWTRTLHLVGEDPIYGTYLDIRLPPTQNGERLAGTLGSWLSPGITGSSPGIFQLVGESNASVSLYDGYKTYEWNGDTITTVPIMEYQPGAFVVSSDKWNQLGMHYFALPFTYEMDGGTPLIAPLAYLGVRIKTGPSSYNYRWILFEDWTNPLMWAYETTPNTPIQIPIPAPAAWLMFAGLAHAAIRHRRR
ncbi:MAG: hypothetical protein IT435_17160 [Phycisphaerales bacterium]|nr:hypothetical protein [Phycisphaerales bacterium]